MIHNMNLSDYLSKNPKKYLIFDFDGTIARIEMDWSGYLAHMSKVYEQFDPSHQHSAFFSYDGYNSFMKDYKPEIVPLAKVANQEYEQAMSSGFAPYPELIEFIKQARGYKMFVYSSNSRAMVNKGLKELGIFDKFEQIVSRNDVTYIKSNPEGFELIYDSSVPKKDYLMIGNSAADRSIAETAEIDFYLVDYF